MDSVMVGIRYLYRQRLPWILLIEMLAPVYHVARLWIYIYITQYIFVAICIHSTIKYMKNIFRAASYNHHTWFIIFRNKFKLLIFRNKVLLLAWDGSQVGLNKLKFGIFSIMEARMLWLDQQVADMRVSTEIWWQCFWKKKGLTRIILTCNLM
jgi:hypothetical protein